MTEYRPPAEPEQPQIPRAPQQIPGRRPYGPPAPRTTAQPTLDLQRMTLTNWRNSKTQLEIKLFEGETFYGTIEWFDPYTVCIKGWAREAEQSTSQIVLIPKHAIIYIREHK